jgi:endonuclease/exonuclease/phosphatase family metal-dependent hydrolase
MKQSKHGWLPGAAVIAAAVAAISLLFVYCAFSEEKAEEEGARHSITVMTWNVHNLFDGKDDGYEYAEFRQSSGWSAEKFMGRINTLSAAIGTLNPMPDIIVLQEIESLEVLKTLALALPSGYSWSHFANNHGAAVGLGIMSRFPITEESRVHSITINGETTPRPVLEARIYAEGGEFVIFACHWKSKIGGDDATENVRRAAAKVILRRIRELWESEPGLGVIVAGDLNENHDEFYRQKSSVLCALMPDDPYCAIFTNSLSADEDEAADLQKDYLIISRNKPPEPVHFPQGAVVLFSPWLGSLENGSYYYGGNWETIDHFLVSPQFFDDTGWEYDITEVANYPPFTNAGGMPVSYNARTGAGLSDHLPLIMSLKMVVKKE